MRQPQNADGGSGGKPWLDTRSNGADDSVSGMRYTSVRRGWAGAGVPSRRNPPGRPAIQPIWFREHMEIPRRRDNGESPIVSEKIYYRADSGTIPPWSWPCQSAPRLQPKLATKPKGIRGFAPITPLGGVPKTGHPTFPRGARENVGGPGAVRPLAGSGAEPRKAKNRKG